MKTRMTQGHHRADFEPHTLPGRHGA